MESLAAPKTIKVYQLLRQSGMSFTLTGSGSAAGIGVGFYLSRDEAEHNRTMSVLKEPAGTGNVYFHVFELEIPNPAYKIDSL